MTPARIAPLGLAALVAGCGGGTRTVTVGTPPRAAGQTPLAAATAKPSRPIPNHVLDLSAFQTPSGNIGCTILSGLARCDIQRRAWSAPARPASCPNVVDYGQGLELAASGAARFVCAGDTVREPRAPKLAYGDATEADGFRCLSEQTGLTCRRGAHGFFLSVQSYKLF
jgi:hypothetical protein